MPTAPLAKRSLDLGNRLIGVGVTGDREEDEEGFIRVSRTEWDSIWLFVESLRQRAALAEKELETWKMANKEVGLESLD